MKCSKCNQENPEGALFCSGCGEALGNPSEEDKRLMAIIRPIDEGAPGTIPPSAARVAAKFRISSVAFALSALLFTASFLLQIYQSEKTVFGDHMSWEFENLVLVMKAMLYTGSLAQISALVGFALILFAVLERHRRGGILIWPSDPGTEIAVMVLLVALVVEAIGLAATVVILEWGDLESTALRDWLYRAYLYSGSISVILVAVAASLAACAFGRSNPAGPASVSSH